MAVGRKAEGAGETCTRKGAAPLLSFGLFEVFFPPEWSGLSRWRVPWEPDVLPGSPALLDPCPHSRAPSDCLCGVPHLLFFPLSPPPLQTCCGAAQAWQASGAQEQIKR